MAPPSRLPIMTRDVTSVEIKKSTWKELNQQKEPGDSFDDVIQRLLARPEEPVEPDPDGEEGESDYHDDAFDCPDCGRSFDSFDELREHMENTAPDHD